VGVIDGTTLASKLGIYSDGRATPKPEDLSKELYIEYFVSSILYIHL